MTSERVQRQIDRLLDEADQAMARLEWEVVRDRARAVLAADPDNSDGRDYLAMATHGSTDTSIQSTASTDTRARAPSPGPQPTSFANGRYAVRKVLGEGGKKKVYLAHDALLDRDVAFALIKTEGLDEAGRQRVNREAQAMGRLGNHPNIVTVYDIGDENGQPYLVLPILSGGDVEGVIEKTPEHKLPLEQALKIAIETCQGLELAHGKGIVHRDLKPDNVWLTEDGRAMIGDFGLAVATDRSRLTQAGMMVGTVSYMPPEQAMGSDVGPRSDLYSLGAMLYEMVCGRPPFVGDESVAIIGQHLNTPPVAPSWHRPDCPPALETLILRLLEKDPSKRPASATEVREALESVKVGTVPARDPSIATEASSVGDNPLYRRTFVGRENEVKQLQQAFNAALSGQGGLVMVVGEPGIGKTALCEQLATYVALRGGKALVGHCYEEGSLSLPYLAFVEAMRSYVLAREPDGLRSDLGTGAADVARIISEVRDRVQGVELRLNGDPEDDRWRLLQAITSFLRNASSVQPIVIVLEDLHWADRGTLDLLLHVSRNLQGARLLIVGTYRNVEVDRSHPLSSVLAELARGATFQRLRLRGLTADEVQRMMAAVAQRDIPWPLAELLHRLTEGSPLFVQEMLRYLVEEGLVAEHEGALRRVGDDTLAGRIPEGLRDVIGKRLTRLGPDANRLLATASLIGREFRLDVLQRVAAMPEDDIIAALEEAKSAAVVEERSSVGAVVTYRFSHAFFSQTLYEEISAPRRIRLHQQVGSALEEVFARRLDEHASELAEHFSHSSDAANLTKAVHYGELAAQRAMSVFDYGEAVRLFERAIEVQEVLNSDDRVKRCDLLLALAEALLPAGEPLRSIHDVCEPAYLLGEDLQDSKRIQRAIRLANEGLSRYGGSSMHASLTGVLWSERAQSNSAPGTVERVWADLETARVKASTRDFKEYRRFAKAALIEARELGEGEAFLAIAQISVNWISVADWREFPAVVDEAIAVLKSAPTGGFQRMLAAFSFCRSLLWQGQKQRAVEILQLLSTMVERTKDRRGGLLQSAIEGLLAFWEGRLGDALEISLDILARGEEQGVGLIATVYARGIAVPTLTYLGRHEEALLNLGDAPAFSSQRTLRLAEAGRSEDARDFLIRTMAELQVAKHGQDLPIRELQLLLETAVLLGDAALCAMLVELLWPLPPLAWLASASPTRVIGEALALLGRAADARAKYEAALNICQASGFRPELALTRLSLAELLLEHYPDERDVAIEHLDFAIAELRDMKMQPALERALSLQGRRPPESKKRLYPDSLSEREVEVLRLLAAGKSNQQIADVLVISINTAQRHLNHIYTKIGATNRVEAAAYAQRHGLN